MFFLHPDIEDNCICVDGACSVKYKKKKGKMQYRGILLKDKNEIFYSGEILGGTSLIAEFLAIVDAMKYIKKTGINRIIYSDCFAAISEVYIGRCSISESVNNEELLLKIEKAEKWLKENNKQQYNIKKWKTDRWGENPADFSLKRFKGK